MTGNYILFTLKKPRFYISIIGVFLLCTMRWVEGTMISADIVTDLDLLIGIDAFRKLIIVFSVIPFVSVFAEEWNSKLINSCLVRINIKKYVWSHVITCFTITFITTFLGFVLFIFVDTFRLPVYVPDENIPGPPYGLLLSAGLPWLEILFAAITFSMSCSMWSIFGLLVSAVLPNVFVAICTPFVASYVLERITLNFPSKLNLLYITISAVSVKDSPVLTFIYSILVFAIISLTLGLIFSGIVKRRIENGVS